MNQMNRMNEMYEMRRNKEAKEVQPGMNQHIDEFSGPTTDRRHLESRCNGEIIHFF
jgi:hypothetical protein